MSVDEALHQCAGRANGLSRSEFYKLTSLLFRQDSDYIRQHPECANVRTTSGTTLLHHYAKYGYPDDIARALVAAGALVSEGDTHGTTPLHLAAEEGNDDVVRTLVDLGADVNSRDVLGWTPLYFALAERKDRTAKVLVSCGADILSKGTDDTFELQVWLARHELNATLATAAACSVVPGILLGLAGPTLLAIAAALALLILPLWACALLVSARHRRWTGSRKWMWESLKDGALAAMFGGIPAAFIFTGLRACSGR
jgi:ankyrin repeat protein